MLVCAVATLLSAFLLFQVQPLVARAILPAFGGTPAVWTTCMLFFQTLLVAGYGYAHLLARRSPRAQARLHGAVLLGSLAVLGLSALAWGAPLLPGHTPTASAGWPPLTILRLLAVSVGVPYVVLSTTGPLLQAWLRRVRPGASPYRLYALSNAGSLLGLLGYPLLVEPALTLEHQAYAWSALFLLFVVATLAAAARALGAPEPPPEAETAAGPPPARSAYLKWAFFAFVSSTLLLASTNQLCQDVASIPLLWVVPLSLYLISFILAFDRPRWYARWLWMPMFAVMLVATKEMVSSFGLRIGWQVLGYSLLLLSGCMVAHGELARDKPPPRYLTGFYLALAVGGALGGAFVGLLAPVIFNDWFEVPVALAGVAAIILWVLWSYQRRWLRLVVPLCAVALVPTLRATRQVALENPRLVTRSFFGVLRVYDRFLEDPVHRRRVLTHGRTMHGIQVLTDEWRHRPTSYYEVDSGVGRAIRLHPRRASGLRVGVVGLGTGTLAAYAQPNDHFRYYEIDPNVIALSRGPDPQFTYLRDARGPVEIVLGDARISLAEELRRGEPQRFDVLAIDAFSSDAIPVHLLTREAVALYVQHLADDGVLALHVSNRHLRLVPVAKAIARDLGLQHLVIDTGYEQEPRAPEWESTWILLARSAERLKPLGPPENDDDDAIVPAWTDEYSNIVRALNL